MSVLYSTGQRIMNYWTNILVEPFFCILFCAKLSNTSIKVFENKSLHTNSWVQYTSNMTWRKLHLNLFLSALHYAWESTNSFPGVVRVLGVKLSNCVSRKSVTWLSTLYSQWERGQWISPSSGFTYNQFGKQLSNFFKS